MEFEVLGPLQLVRPDGTHVNVVSVAQRRLISVLVMRAGSVVSADWLGDLLDLSPGALRTAVSRLRRVVGFDVLVTVPPGYCLRTDRIDADRFEHLLATARGCTGPGAGREALSNALGLWRGNAYAEFCHEDWATTASARLEELRADAIEHLIGLLVGAGDRAEAIAMISPFIAEHPYRDRPRALLMRALAGEGRRADALRAFQTYRRLLIDEIGTEPPPELIALDRAIASSDSLPDHAARSSVVAHPGTRAGDVDHPDNLPASWTSFVGRDREVAAVAGLLDQHRMVTLTGSGGCGKTRLALEVAGRLRGTRDGGTWWVELGRVTSDDQLAERVAIATGFVPALGSDAAEQIVRHLRHLGRVLVVLDNAEHVLDPTVDLVEAMLAGCRDVTVLVTSREPLGLPGEEIWRVPSLTAPEEIDGLTVDQLGTFDSARLFIERARAARPNVEIGESTVQDIALICARLDGVPLALELAAARVRSMALHQVAVGLDDAIQILSGGSRAALSRHRTLHASISWSVNLLGPVERAVLGRLSVFVSLFSQRAAVAVTGEDLGLDAAEVASVLGRLVDKSLLQLDDQGTWYRMLETVRQFCAREVLSPEELHCARARHSAFVAQWCVEVGDGLHGIERGPILAEMPDVVAGMDWARSHSPADALRMCSGLGSLRSTLGHSRNLSETWDWLIAFDRDRTLSAEWASAVAALMAAATGAALDLGDLGPEVACRLAPGDRRAQGWLARGTAMIPAYHGRFEPLVAYAERLVEDRNDVEISIYGGFTAFMLALAGRLADADRWLTEVRRMARRQRAPFIVDTVGNGYAAATLDALTRGHLRAAADFAARPVPRDPGFSMTAAVALAQVAVTTSDRAVLDVAVRWSSRETIPILRFLNTLIACHRATFEGDLVGAADAAEDFWDGAGGVPLYQANQRAFLNRSLLEVGRVGQVERGVRETTDLVRGMVDAPLAEAALLLSRAQLALYGSCWSDALAHGRALLELATAHGFALHVVDSIDVIAVACAGLERTQVAGQLMGAALAERDRTNHRLVMIAPRRLYDEVRICSAGSGAAVPIADAVRMVACL